MSHTFKAIAITTLGCKVNQCDSAAIVNQLQEKGYCLVPFTEEADCYVINTCVVTSSTEAQSRQLIRRALRRSEKAPVIVTGCYAQQNAAVLRAISERVQVAGNAEKKDLPRLIDSLLKGHAVVFDVEDIAHQDVFTTPAAETFAGRSRAFLKIQDGCNSHCAYCIVPSVRGPSRSLPAAQVIDRMRDLVANGYLEIVFTGIHLGLWGLDLNPSCCLSQLLTLCEADTALRGIRFRLSSLEPNEWSDDIIDLMLRSKKLCPHAHIPLQSGDADILHAMGRTYSPGFFHDLVLRLSREIPSINIGIDVIAGLPGETDVCFENTFSLLSSLPAGYLHVFPYSRRPGTRAALMPGQVPAEVIRERMRILRQLSDHKKQTFFERHAGFCMDVLVEGRHDRSTGLLRGITANYIPVLFTGNDALMGTLQRVTLDGIEGSAMRGSIGENRSV
jgi:threonylcarbamoyladenosine tRNA methylthiotransferase MtaB